MEPCRMYLFRCLKPELLEAWEAERAAAPWADRSKMTAPGLPDGVSSPAHTGPMWVESLNGEWFAWAPFAARTTDLDGVDDTIWERSEFNWLEYSLYNSGNRHLNQKYGLVYGCRCP